MFIDMSGDFDDQACFRRNIKLLQETLHFLEIVPSNTINNTYQIQKNLHVYWYLFYLDLPLWNTAALTV